jgi:hypothetical protein
MEKETEFKISKGLKQNLDDFIHSRIFPYFVIFCFFTLVVLLFSFSGGRKPNSQPLEQKQEQIEISPSEECRISGGRYDTKTEVCIYETTDAGNLCEKNKDCEGWCLVDESTQLREESTGFCSDVFKPKGCFKFIDNGKVNKICLPE